MAELAVLHPHGHEFEPFLYASVGEDRNGYVVTVLSALARLSLDPWKEAADLSAMGREAARTRLRKLLVAFHDVPALGQDNGAVAQELVLLLPEPPTVRSSKVPGSATPGHPLLSVRALFAIAMVLLILAQLLFTSAPGLGK
ncbi:MAG: hypothetical protein PF443_01695 [Allgaiera sp.]|jgi:hypothetical protein|nr:hypothetical protein [Allgaiera sp.]